MRIAPNLAVAALASALLAFAQGAPDDGKVLTTFQNPVGDLISVPFQNNINFPIDEFSRIQDVLNIQPVVPIHLNEDWVIISRWIVPVVYQPNLGSACRASGFIATEICEARERHSAPQGGANGLGDVNPTFFLSPAPLGKLIWGVGPTFLLPTATDPTLGQGKRRSRHRLANPAETLDDRVSLQQHMVVRGQPRPAARERVSDAVFRNLQFRARLVSHVVADPHCELAGAG